MGEGESIQTNRKQRLPKVNQVDTRKSQRESRTFRRVLLVRMIRVSGKRFSVYPRLWQQLNAFPRQNQVNLCTQ